MRTIIAGDGSDSTVFLQQMLMGGSGLIVTDLYLIGEPENPASLWLTSWDTPLSWPIWGTFTPASIKRSKIGFKVGLEVSSLDVTWAPKIGTFTNNITTTSPYQLAYMGAFDNQPFRLWKCFMPTPGDANTVGACEWFGGRISQSIVQRNSIKFTVNSFLDVTNQYCPTSVIEVLNTLVGYLGARPPAGLSVVPQFNVISPSSEKLIYGDCTSPTAHQLFSSNVFQQGFLLFNGGTQATLGGFFSAILGNYQTVVGGTTYNAFQLYTPLPWPPTAGVDTFYVSAANPINQSDGDYYGFPFVPPPETAIGI